MRTGDAWQGWRTAYSSNQPRDDRGRWVDGGGGGGAGEKSIQDHARAIGLLGKDMAANFDYHMNAAKKSMGPKFDEAMSNNDMKAILDAAAQEASTDRELESLEEIYGHLGIQHPWGKYR